VFMVWVTWTLAGDWVFTTTENSNIGAYIKKCSVLSVRVRRMMAAQGEAERRDQLCGSDEVGDV